MNSRRTHIMTLDSPSGLFKTKDEAKKALNTIPTHIRRECKKEGINCLGIFALSISDKSNTYRTRYGSKLYKPTLVKNPHIHGTLIIEKQSDKRDDFGEYLKNRYGYYFHSKAVKDDKQLENRIYYSFHQRWIHRTVAYCTDDFIKEYCGKFIEFSEKANKSTKDGKSVFGKYANMIYKPNQIIYNFERSRKHKNELEIFNEVSTKLDEYNTNIERTVELENDLFIINNSENLYDSDIFLPNQDIQNIVTSTTL